VGRTTLVVILAGFFALVGLVMVMAITGFGLATAQCVPGARSVNGLTPMVGGGEMASHLCAAHVPVGLWPWPVVSVVVGATVGGVFAAGLIHTFRSGIGRLRRVGSRPWLGASS
jgi:hypothetical protein